MRLSRMILLACAAPLMMVSACNGTTGAPGNSSDIPAQATAAVERATAAYYRTKPFVDLLVPLLPLEYAARVTRAQEIVERALTLAKAATSATEQLTQLRKAETAMKDIEAVVTPAPG